MRWLLAVTFIGWVHGTDAVRCTEVWTGTWTPRARFTWCVIHGQPQGVEWYTELLRGRAFCHGRRCPLRAASFAATLGVDRSKPFSPADAFPHGIMLLSGQWGRRCTVSGTTQPDPPTRPLRNSSGFLVAPVVSAELVCGGPHGIVIPFVLQRVDPTAPDVATGPATTIVPDESPPPELSDGVTAGPGIEVIRDPDDPVPAGVRIQ
jgi:hypothetical protein